MNPATLEEVPLLLLFALTQTPSFVSIRSPRPNTLSLIFKCPKDLSMLYVPQKFHEEIYFK